jgi:hypothetical protein
LTTGNVTLTTPNPCIALAITPVWLVLVCFIAGRRSLRMKHLNLVNVLVLYLEAAESKQNNLID